AELGQPHVEEDQQRRDERELDRRHAALVAPQPLEQPASHAGSFLKAVVAVSRAVPSLSRERPWLRNGVSSGCCYQTRTSTRSPGLPLAYVSDASSNVPSAIGSGGSMSNCGITRTSTTARFPQSALKMLIRP